MIYLWSWTDFGADESDDMPPDLEPGVGGEWKHETIRKVDHVREAIPYHVKKQVRDKNDAATSPNGKLVCNHYVPYRRIKDALIVRMEGRTRAEIIEELSELRETFNFSVDADPWENKHAFHTWVNCVFSWICNWSENLFYGPPYGDNGGRKIDLATTGSIDLNFRLQNAAHNLWDILRIDVGDHNDNPDPIHHTMDDFGNHPGGMTYYNGDGSVWEPFIGEDGELEN